MILLAIGTPDGLDEILSRLNDNAHYELQAGIHAISADVPEGTPNAAEYVRDTIQGLKKLTGTVLILEYKTMAGYGDETLAKTLSSWEPGSVATLITPEPDTLETGRTDGEDAEEAGT